MAKDGSSHKLL